MFANGFTAENGLQIMYISDQFAGLHTHATITHGHQVVVVLGQSTLQHTWHHVMLYISPAAAIANIFIALQLIIGNSILFREVLPPI